MPKWLELYSILVPLRFSLLQAQRGEEISRCRLGNLEATTTITCSRRAARPPRHATIAYPVLCQPILQATSTG